MGIVFFIFTDTLSSFQALDSNNCNHNFIQDILKLLNDGLSVNEKVGPGPTVCTGFVCPQNYPS